MLKPSALAALLVAGSLISAPALARRDGLGSPLVNAIRDTRRGQTKLSKELGERVLQAVEALFRARAPV